MKRAVLILLASALLALPATSSATIVYDKGGTVYRTTDSGKKTKRLARGGAPYISPDGKRVVFFRKGGKLSYVPARGGRAVKLRLAARQDPLDVLSWAPDGSAIATLSEGPEKPVYVPLNGKAAHSLSGSSATSVSFSPDGKSVVYDQSKSTNDSFLVIQDVVTRATHPLPGFWLSALWSKNGIVGSTVDVVAGTGSVALIQPDGSSRPILRANGLAFFEPISASGDTVVVRLVTGSGDKTPLFAINTLTGTRVQTPVRLDTIYGALSTDGLRNYVVTDGRLTVTNLTTGKTRTLVRRGVRFVAST